MFTQKNIIYILLTLVWIFNLMVTADIAGYVEFKGTIIYPFSLAGVAYLVSLKARTSEISRGTYIFSLLSVSIMFSLLVLAIYYDTVY